MKYSVAFATIIDDDYRRDPGLEPRAGDRVAGRCVLRTFFSPFAQKRFVVYRTGSGRTASVAIETWRQWARKVQAIAAHANLAVAA